MTDVLSCWKCAAKLDDILLPLSRRAECPACNADLHVCKMCEFYDPSVGQACKETVADEVRDKERANFCGYLQPKPNAFREPDDPEAATAKSALDALFGLEPKGLQVTSPESAQAELGKLFGTSIEDDTTDDKS